MTPSQQRIDTAENATAGRQKARDPSALITRQELSEMLAYDAESGTFSWKVCSRGRKAGDSAGRINSNGYLEVWLLGKRYLLHRLAHLLMTGGHPEMEIDHIDGNRQNNKWANLRHVTPGENARNQKLSKANKSGCPGVRLDPVTAKWEASIAVNGKNIVIGRYLMKFEARQARKAAEAKYGYHENHGRKPPQ